MCAACKEQPSSRSQIHSTRNTVGPFAQADAAASKRCQFLDTVSHTMTYS